MNKLYFGDNLGWLEKMNSDSVHLIYLDPPFNSKSSYNILYKSPKAGEKSAQYKAFDDSWSWGDAANEALDQVRQKHASAYEILLSLNNFMNKSDLMAYLAVMTARFIELERVLKTNGSLFLHCDSSASHYLKIILDQVFGERAFRNEIVWKRSTGKSLMKRRLPTNHDVILFYARGDNVWNEKAAFTPYDLDDLPPKIAAKYTHKDPDGRLYQLTDLTNPNPNRPNLTYEFLGINRVWRWTRERMQKAYDDGLVVQSEPGKVPRFKRYLDEQRGMPLDDVWIDIPPINSQAAERLGYPTQKPLALLERIINLASKPGDVVLDPFCGCGTAIEAAEKLGRRWIGIDITVLAIDVVEKRLRRMKLKRGKDYELDGVPLDVAGARRLFEKNAYDFQDWALTLVDGQPRPRGGDKGVDGVVFYQHDAKTVRGAIVSVKGGKNLNPGFVRDLIGTMKDHDVDLGMMITLNKPTPGMKDLARRSDTIEVFNKPRPCIQILTIEQLLSGDGPNLPPVLDMISTAAVARRVSQKRRPKTPTPEEIRESPSFRLTIPGGKMKDAQKDLSFDEPLLVQQPAKPARKKRAG